MFKTLLNLKLLVIVIFSCANCLAQSKSSTYEELIVATWVVKGESSNERLVFKSNGEVDSYEDNQIANSYSWVIEESINNGVKSIYLELENTQKVFDNYNYEINALTDELLVLIFMRKNNMGIGKPITYIRQKATLNSLQN